MSPLRLGDTVLKQFFQDHPSVSFLRVTFVDLSNVVRTGAVMPKAAALRAAETGAIPSVLSPAMAGMTLSGSLNIPALQTGIDELHFDWSTLRECCYCPSHAIVMGFVRCPQPEQPLNGYAFDARKQLQSQLKKNREFRFLVGHEIEFFLYKEGETDFNGPPRRVGMATSAALNPFTGVLDDIVLGLESVGIPILKYHPEDAVLGCFEIATCPLEPMAASDALVYAHETIRAIAQKHGLRATLSPGPFDKGINIGSHFNISYTPADTQDLFLAGLLEHLPAVCAFTMPTVESSTRCARLGTWVRFGVENKLAVIRTRGHGLLEIRCVDATANPYLAAAAIIAAGTHRMGHASLTMKPTVKMGLDPTKEERLELGITKMIPTSLRAALEELETDDLFSEAFGEDLVKTYITLKKSEDTIYTAMSSTDRKADLRMRF